MKKAKATKATALMRRVTHKTEEPVKFRINITLECGHKLSMFRDVGKRIEILPIQPCPHCQSP